MKKHLFSDVGFGMKWVHVHIIWIALVLALAGGLLISLLTRPAHPLDYQPSAIYFEQHFKLNQPHPPPGVTALPPVQVFAPARPASAHVNYAYLDTALNQGQVGQCQCYAFRYQYEYDTHRRHLPIKHWSCKFWYGLVMNLFDGGRDTGSNIFQYQQILSQTGGVPHGLYDYSGNPNLYPNQLQWPIPGSIYQVAAQHKYLVTLHVISLNTQGGQNATNGIQQAIANGHPVNLNLPVWYTGEGQNSLFDLTPTYPYIDSPAHPTWTPNGYHAVTIVGYDRHACVQTNVGRWCGLYKAINSWGADFGVNQNGQPSAGHSGFFYITGRFIRTYGYNIVTVKLQKHVSPTGVGVQAGTPPVWHQPGPALDKPVPPPPSRADKQIKAQPGLTSSQTFVKNVFAKDLSNYDMAPAINAFAHAHGLNPVGVLATIGAECGLYTHSTQCDRVAGGLDISFGACQVTVSTASGYGIGNGIWDGYYGSNGSRVRLYENNPYNCTALGAEVLGSFSSYEQRNCPAAADFPSLYVAWNAGPAQPCWFLLGPTGQAGTNYYNNFLGWMRWAYGYAVGYNPYGSPAPRPRPKPKPAFHFPKSRWCRWEKRHHHFCPAYRNGRHIRTIAFRWATWKHAFGGRYSVDHVCGGVKDKETWWAHYQFEKQHFQHCVVLEWPHDRGAPTKWIHDPHA